MGKSPMKTVCSLISPVEALTNRARTKMGAEYVMAFSLHAVTANWGGGRRSSSSGSNSSSSCRVSVKSLMGEISANVSFRPCWRNQSKDFRWIAIRSGSGRASSMFANEYRSRMRVDNESLLNGFGRPCEPRLHNGAMTKPVPTRSRARMRARPSHPQSRESGTEDARQPTMLGHYGRHHNPRDGTPCRGCDGHHPGRAERLRAG